MLNCTETYRSRDKKPGDNILNAFVSDGGVADALNTLNSVIHDNDVIKEIVTTNLNNTENLFTLAQATVSDYRPLIDSYNAAFDEIKQLGKPLPLSAVTRTETTD